MSDADVISGWVVAGPVRLEILILFPVIPVSGSLQTDSSGKESEGINGPTNQVKL